MTSDEELGIDFEMDDVVIEVLPKQKHGGSGYEWTYRFRRVYDFRGEMKSAYFFRREHDERISKALVYVINWMNENDPNLWVKKQLTNAA